VECRLDATFYFTSSFRSVRLERIPRDSLGKIWEAYEVWTTREEDEGMCQERVSCRASQAAGKEREAVVSEREAGNSDARRLFLTPPNHTHTPTKQELV
jgi:hypothetical protein